MAASDCDRIQTLIPLFIDNMLSAKEAVEVREHIDACETCKKEYAFMQSVLCGLSSLPEQPLPADFHKNLMSKVRETKAPKRTYSFSFKRVAGFAAAAAVLVLSVVSYFNVEESRQQNANPDVYLTAPAQQEKTITEPKASAEEPSATEKTVDPKKTSAPKPSVKPQTQGKTQNDASGSASGFAREREIPEEHAPALAQAEASVAPVVEEAENVPAYHSEVSSFVCATVTVLETEREAAEEILSGYERSEEGYLVGENLESVLEKLSALDGYEMTKEENDTLTENILVLK